MQMANAAAASIHQIAAVSGHKTLKEVERYTRGADQQRLAQAAIARTMAAETKPKRRKAGGLLR